MGVADSPLVEAKPLQPASQRQVSNVEPSRRLAVAREDSVNLRVSLQKLLARAASHSITTDEAAALSARLAALNGQITKAERAELAAAGGRSLHQIARDLAEATDEDAQEQAQALALARGIRLSGDTPPSWRTWLLLDVARACTDVGDAEGAVKALESLYRRSPQWMRHHTLAVAIVRDLWASPARPPGLRKLVEFLDVIG